MKSILELFYQQPTSWRENLHEPDSIFVKTARIKSENLDLLLKDLTDNQKQWFDAYCDADGKIEEMIHFDQFSYAFHLGAQLMLEMIQGKQELLGV